LPQNGYDLSLFLCLFKQGTPNDRTNVENFKQSEYFLMYWRFNRVKINSIIPSRKDVELSVIMDLKMNGSVRMAFSVPLSLLPI